MPIRIFFLLLPSFDGCFVLLFFLLSVSRFYSNHIFFFIIMFLFFRSLNTTAIIVDKKARGIDSLDVVRVNRMISEVWMVKEKSTAAKRFSRSYFRLFAVVFPQHARYSMISKLIRISSNTLGLPFRLTIRRGIHFKNSITHVPLLKE